MPRLFSEGDARYSDQANDLDMATQQATTDIFDRYVRAGFSPREVAYVMMAAIHEIELMTLVGWRAGAKAEPDPPTLTEQPV